MVHTTVHSLTQSVPVDEKASLLKVYPATHLNGLVHVPPSKPETQRAVFISAISEGVTRVFNDLRCSETETMKEAFRAVGCQFVEHPDHLEVHGIGGNFTPFSKVIDAKGSGLVFRCFSALASVINYPVIITGDSTLRARVMEPLFNALRQLGASLECVAEPGKAPIVNWSNQLPGGSCTLPGNVSSQFITALLLTAPLAENPVEIEVKGEVYSKSYIDQTVAAMQYAGVAVETSQDYDYFKVAPAQYRPQDFHITADYTSASYLLARSVLFKGVTVLKNIQEESLQGERFIIDILRVLGADVFFKKDKNEVVIHNHNDRLEGNYEFNVINCPNIVPTLVALGAFVTGTFRVVGASITRLHKAPRVEAMTCELRKLGVDIEPIYNDGVCDGFEIHGRETYEGGVEFSSWGDHRIFMSLFIVSLKTKKPNYLDGFSDVICSFPEFLSEFRKDGVHFEVVYRNTKNSILATQSIG
ncbi:MAG: 3-phosphoshikimate 1-carboxyvinyltransferase [Cyanobacteria bacterium CRU_2_1]|nr:3-phosphoshikimate 1-carboxyvinyltransferase [Cyanobacteria bacterium CRU_2_1]